MSGGDVIHFPAEITAQAELREAQRRLAHVENNLKCGDARERALAECIIDSTRDDVARAERAVTIVDMDDTLVYHGAIFRAHMSSAGAN